MRKTPRGWIQIGESRTRGVARIPLGLKPSRDSRATSQRDSPIWIQPLGVFRYTTDWAPSQYPKRRLSVRSRKVSKPRDLYLELSDRSEIWQALRQHCCRCACQISKRYDNLKYQSRGFETLRDLKKRRLFGYWDGALVSPLVSHRLRPKSVLAHGIPKLLLFRKLCPVSRILW